MMCVTNINILLLKWSTLYCTVHIWFTHLHLSIIFFQIDLCSVPLGIAAERGHPQTVERLLKGGANVNHQNKVMRHSDLVCRCI